VEWQADCSPATKRHLDRPDEWADALGKDGAVTCADLSQFEARWRAVYAAISNRRRSGVALTVSEVPSEGVPVVRDEVWIPPAPEATVTALGSDRHSRLSLGSRPDPAEAVQHGGE
jgi:hypothetical protein